MKRSKLRRDTELIKTLRATTLGEYIKPMTYMQSEMSKGLEKKSLENQSLKGS